MKTILILLTALITSLSFRQAKPVSHAANAKVQNSAGEAQKLNKLLYDYDEESLKLNPVLATFRGDNRYNDQLPAETEAYRRQEKALYTTYLKLLSLVDRTKLEGENLLNYQIFDYTLKENLQRIRFEKYLLPINQFSSPHTIFAVMGSGKSFVPFQTVKDYENFLKRISGFQLWADTAIGNMQKGIAKGVVQPKVLMEKVLPQLEAMLVSDIKKSTFFQPVTNMPATFSEEDKTRLQEAYTKAIEEQIIPSYRKLYEFIKKDYFPRCRSTVSISALPQGKEQYAFLVESFTTTSLSPEQIFDIGMKEVKRIRQEMEKIKEQVGFQGDLNAFFKYITSDAKFYPFQTEEEILQAYRNIHTRMLPQLNKTFNLVPKASFEVRAVEKYRAATMTETYFAPSADGSRPGIFYASIVDPKKYNSYRMEMTFLHEAIPGHHFQIALQQEQTHLPNLRKFGSFTAYVEGWGLYTESLGKELGLYTDPYQYMGRLAWDMHRALRLVLDVGIHYKDWTREQAIDFSKQNEPMAEAEIISEIERYIANPGQALAYKIGELKIMEIRNKAQKVLGKRFDIRAFHDQILKDGALPLAVLETKMNTWMKNQQALSQVK